MALSIDDRAAYGDAVLERLSGSVDAAMKADHAAFKKQHLSFKASGQAVAAAEKVYLKALADVGALDKTRDKTVFEIADEMPSAKLGTRASPFGDFCPYSPSRLVSLSYAAETREVAALVSKLVAANPPPAIGKLCARLTNENTAVDEALKALSKPGSALNEARSARDATLADWDKTFRHLKETAKPALRDSPGRFEAVFASPEAVQTNVRPTRRAAKSAPTPESPAGDGAPVKAPAAPKKAKKRARRK